ncbi:hypothetical protein GJ700_22075 [Duganella sp. FT92W]|uniref:Proteinase inhibitor I42 chagasin domain-containing protein n=1 Tax=Pseudoduganella rivuli TaxID=2666085 RepID=A0A7X2LTC2_9BURK|nr:hypothetical protein [Pseudoduganella rivuli]MRV74400.1 hypothetical protein [Pseudoduganella rivuli]
MARKWMSWTGKGGALVAALALAAAGASLSGCSRSERWQEQVRLQSGDVIVVDRRSTDEGTAIRFSLPSQPGKSYYWRAAHDGGQGQHENPLVLDVENGVPVIYTVVSTSPGCRLFTRYAYRDGDWWEQVLPDKFQGREMNLFVLSGLDIGDMVTLEQKRRESAAVSYSRALRFLGPGDKTCGL